MTTIYYHQKAYSYEELHVGKLKPFEWDFLEGKEDPLYKLTQWELDQINRTGKVTPLHFEYAEKRRRLKEAGIKDDPAYKLFSAHVDYGEIFPPEVEHDLEGNVGKEDHFVTAHKYLDLMVRLYTLRQYFEKRGMWEKGNYLDESNFNYNSFDDPNRSN